MYLVRGIIPETGVVKGAARIRQLYAFSSHLLEAGRNVVDNMLLADTLFIKHVYDAVDLFPNLVWFVGRETDATPASSDLEEKDGSKGNHCCHVEGDTNEGFPDVGDIKDY